MGYGGGEPMGMGYGYGLWGWGSLITHSVAYIAGLSFGKGSQENFCSLHGLMGLVI